MTKYELLDMLLVVKADLIRSAAVVAPEKMALAEMCQFAIWYLKGEPSFVQRNDEMRRKADERDT